MAGGRGKVRAAWARRQVSLVRIALLATILVLALNTAFTLERAQRLGAGEFVELVVPLGVALALAALLLFQSR